MSLDVYLEGAASNSPGTGIFIREGGQTKEITRREWDERFPGREPAVALHEPNECYEANITHNLGKMAAAAGIYEYLWRPDEIGVTHARQLIHPLTVGLSKLLAEPEKFKALNPSNHWGSYEGLVAFVGDYLEACHANPDATVRVSR